MKLKKITTLISRISLIVFMLFAFANSVEAQMNQLLNIFGKYQVRADACGTNGANCPITIEKPAGATTVHRVYIYYATIYQQATPPPANAVTLSGGGFGPAAINMTSISTATPNTWVRYMDATGLLGAGLNAAPAGTNITYTSAEAAAHTSKIDGVGIIVVWNNPTVLNSAVHVSIGCDNTGTLVTDNIITSPINTGLPGFQATLGVGINFAVGDNTQRATLSINGTVIDTWAGGYDDGLLSNGALITLGGFGDSRTANTDELYDIAPNITNGSTMLTYSIITSTTHNLDYINAVYFEITGVDPPNDTLYVCNGDSAILVADPGTNFNWYVSGTPGTSLGTNDTLIVFPTTNTNYVVNVDGTLDTVVVIVNPTYSSNVNTTICQGDSVLLEGAYQTTSGIYNDTLYTVNGCDSIIITNLTVNPVPVNNVNASICQSDSIFLAGAYQNTSGVYNDTISAGAANGCDSIVVTTLTVNQFVTGNANAQICQGDSILLGGVYQTLAGNYNDTIFGGSASGCDSIVITNLSIIPTSMGSANARICDNDSILIGNMYYSSAGVYPYTIPNGSASGCDSIVNVTLTVDYAFSNHQDLIICQGDSALVGGQYVSKFGFNQVSYQSINGCDSTYTATISFIPQYDFYLPEDTTLCMGQTFILSPYINSTYYNLMWENGSTNQYREVDTSGTFIMTYSHKSCDHQGSDEINVLFENCDFFIYVPNTFTPNKDGLNDGFAPVIYGEFTDYSFRIFDRWGEVIFESSTHGESWKGTYMNELVKTDVYVWKLIVKPKKDKEITQTGKVTILK